MSLLSIIVKVLYWGVVVMLRGRGGNLADGLRDFAYGERQCCLCGQWISNEDMRKEYTSAGELDNDKRGRFVSFIIYILGKHDFLDQVVILGIGCDVKKEMLRITPDYRNRCDGQFDTSWDISPVTDGSTVVLHAWSLSNEVFKCFASLS